MADGSPKRVLAFGDRRPFIPPCRHDEFLASMGLCHLGELVPLFSLIYFYKHAPELIGAFLLQFEALKANHFAASVIRAETGQSVIDSGPYALMRHPMYSGSMMYCLVVPLALGSFVAWPIALLITPLLLIRIIKEEKFLRQNLAGYSEYCQKTRYRLLPLVW